MRIAAACGLLVAATGVVGMIWLVYRSNEQSVEAVVARYAEQLRAIGAGVPVDQGSDQTQERPPVWQA